MVYRKCINHDYSPISRRFDVAILIYHRSRFLIEISSNREMLRLVILIPRNDSRWDQLWLTFLVEREKTIHDSTAKTFERNKKRKKRMIRMFSIKNCLFFGRLFPLESSGSLDILEFHRDQVSFPFFNPSLQRCHVWQFRSQISVIYSQLIQRREMYTIEEY